MNPHLLTIGHSNHSLDRFLSLLEQHGVEVLVDVRSQPASRYSPHFNDDALKKAVVGVRRKYLFLGAELGGRPNGSAFYDAEGYVLYDRVASSQLFNSGIERLLRGLSQYRVAIMCSEENPEGCHRRLLVGRVLGGHGVTVTHIRGDGAIESESDLLSRETSKQVGLFAAATKETAWKSIRSVLPSTTPNGSSGSYDEHESVA